MEVVARVMLLVCLRNLRGTEDTNRPPSKIEKTAPYR